MCSAVFVRANGRPRPDSGAAQPVFSQTRIRKNTARRQKCVGRRFTSAQVPLRPPPCHSLKTQILCFPLFSLALSSLSRSLFFPISSFLTSVLGHVGRRYVAWWPEATSLSAGHRNGGIVCMCVCVRALREGDPIPFKSWLCVRARLPGRTRLIHQSPWH